MEEGISQCDLPFFIYGLLNINIGYQIINRIFMIISSEMYATKDE